jgi:Holliday junction resolvase-like predicted endonuclease
MVVAHLVREGWQIVSEANTASRQPGIDIVAARETEELAVPVKGFPGRGFADPRRAHEQKRAHPSGQAKG